MTAGLRGALATGRARGGRLALAAALGVGAAGSAVGLAAVSAWLIARAAERPPVLHLMVAVVAVRALGLGRGVFRYAERLVGHDAAFRLLGDLRVAVVTRLERVLPSARPALRSGDALGRLVGDVDALVDLWVRVVVPVAVAVVVAAGSVALATVLLPSAGLVLGVTVLVGAVGGPVVSRRVARGAAARLAPLRGAYQAALVDLFDGAEELAVLGALDGRLADLEALDDAHRRAARRAAFATGLAGATGALSAGAALWASLLLGSRAVEGGSLAPVRLALVVLLPLAVHEVVAGVPVAADALVTVSASAERVAGVLAMPDEVVDPLAPAAVPEGPYGLRVRGLVAAWAADDGPVLTGLDLDVAAGSRVAIVGPSGAGKSTIAAVLLRFLAPTAGTVELVTPSGAVDLRALAGDDVRGIIGWCAQDAHLFDSTIAANVRLARPDADDDEVRAALAAAGLGGWLAATPAGLDTLVGEHGQALSGGQRQRVALARVLLADRPVVVFDEPTEHLPDDLASDLLAHMLTAAAGRAVLLITHRPDLLPPVDAVLELRGGVLSARAGDAGRARAHAGA